MSRFSPDAFDDLVRSALTSRAQSIVIDPAPTSTRTSPGDDASTDAPTRERRPRRGALVAVSATVLVAVVAALGAIALTRGGDTPSRVLTPPAAENPGAAPPFPEECSPFPPDGLAPGCPPGVAEPLLGFVARVPTQVPNGWVSSRASLESYDPLQPGARPVPTYYQEWTLPGLDIRAAAASGGCPSYLTIIQRKADHEEIAEHAPDGPWPGNIDLGDGEIIGGGWETASCPDGEQYEATQLNWVEDGIFFRVFARGVDHETLLAIVRSFSP